MIPTDEQCDAISKRNVDTIARLEAVAKEPAEGGERIAGRIANFCGTFTFVWTHFIWFSFWIAANLLLPATWRFDPLPFSFLTLIVSLEAIFLSGFILISQNRQGNVSERRAHLDLQVNLLAEQENTKMLEILERIAVKLGVASPGDSELEALKQATSAEKLMVQIDDCLSRPSGPSRH